MQNKALTVDDYLREVPADRLASMQHLRRLCTAELRGYDENMQYGMPTYTGESVVAFNSQKNYISFYFPKSEIIDKYRNALKANIGKSCIRFSKPEHIDFNVLKSMLRDLSGSIY
jgi:uncharacterized protein YdhG (YjbR/CyaY superfamily)